MRSREELIIPYHPHPRQLPFHQTQTKHKALITGVGFGKSAAIVVDLIRKCVEKPGGLRLLIAPTLPMMKNTTLREFFKFLPPKLLKEHHKGDKIIRLDTEPVSEIIYLSGDNERDIDRLRGLTLRDAYGDELCLSPYYIFEIIQARLRDPGGDLQFGIATTPKGFNWLYWLFARKCNPKTHNKLKKPDKYDVFTGSVFDNPYTPKEYKDTLEASYIGAFAKQELYGEFIGYEGLVYQNFSRNLHVLPQTPKKFKRYYGAADFGYTNPSVYLVVGVDSDDRLYIIDEFYQKGVLIEDYVKEVKRYNKKYKIVDTLCDPAAPEYIAALNNIGVPAKGVHSQIMDGISMVAQRLEKAGDGKPRLFVHESCVNTIMEFENYRYPETKEDKPIQEKPLKIHDHALDALRYLVYEVNRDTGGFVPLKIDDLIR